MAKVENNETKTIYKCAICGKEHSTIPERANCEQECYKKLEIERKQALEEKKKKEQEGRKAELDAALKYAYDLKERYLSFNNLKNKELAAEQLNDIINEYKISDIKEFIEVAKTLKHWKEEIVNSFTFYNNRKITNGPIEAKNGTIRKILSNGNGYTNFQRERNRIFYCFNDQWITDPLLENVKIKRKGKPRGKYKKTR